MSYNVVNWAAAKSGARNGSSEFFTLPSCTVPNMAIPIETLFERYVRSGVANESIYDDSLPPGVEHLDFFERQDLLSSVTADIQVMQANLQSKADERERMKAEADAVVVPPIVDPTLPKEGI